MVKYTIENLQQYAETLNGKCLSSIYKTNNTIYNCDICNKQLCSKCLIESNTTEYCKDCFVGEGNTHLKYQRV